MATTTMLTNTTKQWQNDDGYQITLTLGTTRSSIEVRDAEGATLIYRDFEYWQRAQAEKEATALVNLARAFVPVPLAAEPQSAATAVGNVSLFRARVPQASTTAA